MKRVYLAVAVSLLSLMASWSAEDVSNGNAWVTQPLTYPYVYPISGMAGTTTAINNVSSAHDGYDLFGRAGPGTPIVASHSGYVLSFNNTENGSWSGPPSNPGRFVNLVHGSHRSRYHHLQSVAPGIATGVWVAAGQIIGYQGQTGNGGFSHLHVEWRRFSDGEPLNFNSNIVFNTRMTAGGPIAYTGQWHLSPHVGGTVKQVQMGFSGRGDVPISGDWNGDGRDEIGFVKVNQSNGNLEWYTSSTNLATAANGTVVPPVYQGVYGSDADIAVPGDWDGNNTDSPGIVRRNGNDLEWHLANSFSSGTSYYGVYGAGCSLGCVPVRGDWDANGADSRGVFAVSGAGWFLSNSVISNVTNYSFSWGNQSDLPISGEVLTNNADRPWLFRESPSGTTPTFFRNSGLPGTTSSFGYGASNDYPIVLNWDSDTLDEYGIVR